MGFKKCVQFPIKLFSRQKHTIPNNKGYKKYPNNPVLGRSQLQGEIGEKSQGPNKKEFVCMRVFVCVLLCVCASACVCVCLC